MELYEMIDSDIFSGLVPCLVLKFLALGVAFIHLILCKQSYLCIHVCSGAEMSTEHCFHVDIHDLCHL